MTPALDAHDMLAVALEQARIGFEEGGVPVGGAIFGVDGTLLGVGRNRLVQEGNCSLHGETDAFRAAGRRPTWHDTILVTTLAPCWYCTGLIYQFRFRQVIVGDSVNDALAAQAAGMPMISSGSSTLRKTFRQA